MHRISTWNRGIPVRGTACKYSLFFRKSSRPFLTSANISEIHSAMPLAIAKFWVSPAKIDTTTLAIRYNFHENIDHGLESPSARLLSMNIISCLGLIIGSIGKMCIGIEFAAQVVLLHKLDGLKNLIMLLGPVHGLFGKC